MNLAKLQNKLIAAGRRQEPDLRVPYAFEKRIMARLAARERIDHWAFWVHGMWRAAASSVAVAGLFMIVCHFQPVVSESGHDLTQDLENTLLASAEMPDISALP